MPFPTDISQIPPPEGQGRSGVAFPQDSTKSPVTTTPVTEADLNELRGEFRESMMGDNFAHMDAARYDTEGRGLYSAQPTLNPEQPVQQPEQPVYQEAPPPPQPAQNWQNLYGQSENEKGQWRTLAQQQAEQLLLLQQQVAAVQAGGGNSNGAWYNQPADPPPRIFPERQPGELMTWGEMEQVLLQEVLPTMDLRARQAQDMATARTQRLMPQWDVSPQEEAAAVGNLRMRFPGLDSRFTATEINSMIQDQASLARQFRGNTGMVTPPTATTVGRIAPQGGQNPQTAPPATVFVDPNRVVRRATYIETAPPAQVSSEPMSQMTPGQAFQSEVTALERSQNRRLSAVEYRNLLIKHGVGVGNDFGPDASMR